MNGADPRWHVQIRDLWKSFGSHQVLSGVDLDLERGKMNVIVGASGSGKSVLLKHLVGLLTPDQGKVWVSGVDIFAQTAEERAGYLRKVGFLFQSTALFDSLTVEQNLAFPAVEHSTMSADEIKDRSYELLRRLGLKGSEKKLPAELSGGMRKRAALARALMLDPELLLYDEPTTGLDPLATEVVDELVLDIARSRSVTSVVISHDMSSVFRIADRIAVIEDGKIAACGTPDEVRADPGHYVRTMLSLSGVRAARPI